MFTATDRVECQPMLFIYVLLALFFWPCHAASIILVPWPGTEPVPLAVKAQSSNHWTTRELPASLSYIFNMLGVFFFYLNHISMDQGFCPPPWGFVREIPCFPTFSLPNLHTHPRALSKRWASPSFSLVISFQPQSRENAPSALCHCQSLLN